MGRLSFVGKLRALYHWRNSFVMDTGAFFPTYLIILHQKSAIANSLIDQLCRNQNYVIPLLSSPTENALRSSFPSSVSSSTMFSHVLGISTVGASGAIGVDKEGRIGIIEEGKQNQQEIVGVFWNQGKGAIRVKWAMNIRRYALIMFFKFISVIGAFVLGGEIKTLTRFENRNFIRTTTQN